MKFIDDIGAVVKRARKDQNITLRQVSEATGISVGFLSQFERGICNISIDALAKVAEALSISVEEFFRPDQVESTEKYRIMRPHELSPSQISNHAVQYHLNGSDQSAFLPRIHVLLPYADITDQEIASYSHAGEEFVLVLEGVLTLFVEGNKHALYPGDSLYLESGVAHNWLNLGSKVVKVLSINYPNPLVTGESGHI